mmetsp:Transcript_73520/g.209237  ORF Transcript_73520/g.209237 Transcript_73520/m.209237 type:complete len:316 (+) Transcript_73520:230-1177(+)|eukprot:CAMPEP_0182564216 /NCGR_PEP_ID=MMETSP1324-20130603/6201_1 /TAXON_ID=236786 /ORGANISM="Florenciella sp., Strain RCC1587" /LENGTH=315 /DNA_ID=CAMNT_0024777617 /DNA_START=116 /DNA_END=1063 /DNA_ORIENTATION=-
MFRASALRVAATAARPAGAKAGAAPRLLTQPVQAMVARSYHASIPAREEEKEVVAEPKEESALSAYFGNPLIQAPIGFILAIPLLQNQVLILSEELQLLGCFMVFVGSVYSQAGEAIGKALDEKGESVMAEHNAQEQVQILAAKAVIEAHEQKLSLVDEMKAIHSTQAELLSMLADAKSMELQYMLKADIVKKLDFVVQKEENFRAAQQTELAEAASVAVTAQFTADKDLQGKALAQALEAIASPDKAGEDVVGAMFTSYFANYVKEVQGSTSEVEIPASVIAEAKAEILAMRARDGNDDTSLPDFPTKVSLASL